MSDVFKATIKPESAALSQSVELLLDRVFGADRREKASYLYRQGIDPIAALSWVAVENPSDDGKTDGRLVGAIRYWPVLVGDAHHKALLLGPLAITPELAGKGIGRALTFRTLEIAAELYFDLVLLVGDYDYYKRFGFVPATPYGFVMPGEQRPERLQVTELKPGVLGRVSGEIRLANAETVAAATVVAAPVPARRRVRRASART
jgi:predicted N-acetyltransferase YhbS